MIAMVDFARLNQIRRAIEYDNEFNTAQTRDSDKRQYVRNGRRAERHGALMIKKTEKQLIEIVVGELSRILGNQVSLEGLRERPTALKPEDVDFTYTLFERLGCAYEALAALRPRYGRHPGFESVDTE